MQTITTSYKKTWNRGSLQESYSEGNNLMAAAGQQTIERQQQQLEQRTMSSMKLSIHMLKALTSLEALLIFERVANSGRIGIDNTSLAGLVLPHITRKQYYLRLSALK